MKRVLLSLSIAAFALVASAPASAQGKGGAAPPPVAAQPADDRLWSLTLTVRPDQARKAADDIVKLVKDPTAPAPTLLSNVLGIFSAELTSTTASREAARKAAERGPMANMATSACAAAVDTLGQQAAVVKNGYAALAAGLPPDKVGALQQQVRTMADQLAAAARTAADQIRKEPATPKTR